MIPAIFHLTQILIFLNIIYDPCRCTNEVLIANANVVGDVRFSVARVELLPIFYHSTEFFSWFQFSVWLGRGLDNFILDEMFRAIVFL